MQIFSQILPARHCISVGWVHFNAFIEYNGIVQSMYAFLYLALTQGLTDDWRVRLAFPIFQAIDFLLSRQRIARYLFNSFRTKDNLKRVLQRVYINPEAVDDALVDLIHTPSGLAHKAHPRYCHDTASVRLRYLQSASKFRYAVNVSSLVLVRAMLMSSG